MSQPLTCPHSSIGICVPCYIGRYTAGETMPDPDPDVCICGRGMTKVLTCNIDDDTGVVVRVNAKLDADMLFYVFDNFAHLASQGAAIRIA